MTPKLWMYVGIFVIVLGMFLRMQYLDGELESAQDVIRDYKQKSEKAKKEYKDNLKIYTQKVIELDSQLRDELDKIDNFKEDVNETKCENAVRFFNSFEY